MTQTPAPYFTTAPTANRGYTRYTWFVFGMVMFVILAGGVVRMTQSGMGCPDWPTCFGRWIPPLNESQLPPDFEKYLDKQQIDHSFNVYHTWIEYINRLLGALLGVFIFIHTIWSFRKFWKTRPVIFYLSLLLLLAVAFQGWMGKKVVDANLEAVKVTIHMFVALVIAAIPVLIINKIRTIEKVDNRFLKWMTLVTLVITLVQIFLGTQVREQIDVIGGSLNYKSRETWIEQLDNYFSVHRTFSIVVMAMIIYLFWRCRNYNVLRPTSTVILILGLSTLLLGLIMNYLGMPPLAQPLHLLMAALLTMHLLILWLKIR